MFFGLMVSVFVCVLFSLHVLCVCFLYCLSFLSIFFVYLFCLSLSIFADVKHFVISVKSFLVSFTYLLTYLLFTKG